MRWFLQSYFFPILNFIVFVSFFTIFYDKKEMDYFGIFFLWEFFFPFENSL